MPFVNGPSASVASHSLRVNEYSLSAELHSLRLRRHSLSVSVSMLLEYGRNSFWLLSVKTRIVSIEIGDQYTTKNYHLFKVVENRM